MKIGFIGYGNMAQAIVKGLCQNKEASFEIYACAKHYDGLLERVKHTSVHPLKNAREVSETCDLIFLAIKPHQVEEVITEIKDVINKQIFISVVAGYSYARYTSLFPCNTAYLCTIPNTPVAVGAGIFVCERQHSLSSEQLACVTQLLQEIAILEWVDTDQLSIAGTISGCAPAFTAMYLEALADAGVMYGLNRESAYRMAAQMCMGTSKLYQKEGLHPGMMKDAVCSPKGTTILGVAQLKKDAFQGSVIRAIEAIEGKRS